MQQFQSLRRLLLFYTLTLFIMLSLYYLTIFVDLEADRKQSSVDTFNTLTHKITQYASPVNSEISAILQQPFFAEVSYQLIFMMPSGQTYIHRHTRPDERLFATMALPTNNLISNQKNSTYKLTNDELKGTIKLKGGRQLYVILRHQPLIIDWISYRYWLPLIIAIMLFMMALLYVLKRSANWEQLLHYSDTLSSTAKDAYIPPPFVEKSSTSEFLRLGHALSRISSQLHNNHRRISTLQHRLLRLVDQSPLPMMMIMRHGQISFFNQRFEQTFATSFQSDSRYQLTDFFTTKDASTESLLHKLVTQRITRTLIVYGRQDNHAYQLHLNPWFGEHGQVHGFTVLLSPIDEFTTQIQTLQKQNQQLKQELATANQFRSMVSRELRLPLHDIIDVLDKVSSHTLSPERQNNLDAVMDASRSMLVMLNDMMSVDEISADTARISATPVDIYELGRDVSAAMTEAARRQRLDLSYFFAPNCPRYIRTDKDRLRQILTSFFDKIIAFISFGHAVLTIELTTTESLAKKENLLTTLKATTKTQIHLQNKSTAWIRFCIQGLGVRVTRDSNEPKHRQFIHQTNLQTAINANPIEQAIATAHSFAQLLGGFANFNSHADDSESFELYIPCLQPRYEPVYHPNPQFTQCHLIAIINQELGAKHLQQLCQHLSMPASIYHRIELDTLPSLITELRKEKRAVTPIILLDYDYFLRLKPNLQKEGQARTVQTQERSASVEEDFIEAHHASDIEKQITAGLMDSTESSQALVNILALEALPKMLISMQSERQIPFAILDQCDSFLNKPLDPTLLLSELVRLSYSNHPKPAQRPHIKDIDLSSNTVADASVKETLAPLILVVEDSLTNQKITCKLLEKLGYRSIVAADGQQALIQLQSRREEISLILMDCRMPIMDGLQATQAIREQGDDIPIVALTANTAEEDREACTKSGMDEFLSKPVNKEKLSAVLSTFIKV